MTTASDQIAAWNAASPVPAKVIYNGRQRETRAAAQVLGDGRAVVWLDTYMGAVDLDAVTPA